MNETRELPDPNPETGGKTGIEAKSLGGRSAEAVKAAFDSLPAIFKKVKRSSCLPVFIASFQILSLLSGTYQGDPMIRPKLDAVALLRDMRSEEHQADRKTKSLPSIGGDPPETDKLVSNITLRDMRDRPQSIEDADSQKKS